MRQMHLKGDSFRWLLLIPAFVLSACETVQTARVLEKDAQSDEVRKETLSGVPLPPGCSQTSLTKPTGKKDLTISYQEPTTDEKGAPLNELAYTTVYLSSGEDSAQAIRVWTNDPHGGAKVTIHHVVPPAEKFSLCVTATNWSRVESPPQTGQTPVP
ncbi:MAG TPA: hypothetical protein VJU54_12940 [Nitrospiraceae bacterium]|nr:hypothetical protein [Nitrospiraceae bacterium]